MMYRFFIYAMMLSFRKKMGNIFNTLKTCGSGMILIFMEWSVMVFWSVMVCMFYQFPIEHRSKELDSLLRNPFPTT